MGKILLSLGSLCSITFPAFGSIMLPKEARVPGGIAIITIDLPSEHEPVVTYMDKRTCVIANPKAPNTWITIIGIPLAASIGLQQIQISSPEGIVTQDFVIKPKKYPVEHLTIPNKRKVEPLAEDLAKIETEYLETIKTYDHWQYKKLDSLKLALPLKGRKSSPFGLQRIMNNIPKNAHSGLDIAAPLGTNVACAKDGIVINIGNYFYSGNIVFVDHGQGFITSYCHLNAVLVEKGQYLQKGDLIGKVGKTGRATGPHLHWSVSLNGVRVDPQLFINE